MNLFERMDIPLVEAIGWTLLHFVWQGTVIAAVVAVTLTLLRHRDARARYAVGCLGMFVMMAAPVVTMAVLLARDVPASATLPAAAGLPAVGDSLTGRIDALAPGLTFVWVIGTFAFHLRYLGCWLGAQRLRSHATAPLPPALNRTLMTLLAPLAVHRDVRILKSALARVPMVIGWLRPVILLPVTVLEELTPPQIRAVVAHELAHVRRHDYLVNLVQAGFESLLFYHPAVWWLSGRIRTEREYCCDDIAARVCGDTICYARALALLDELRAEPCVPALAATGGSLMNRITRLLGVRPAPRPTYRAGTALWIAPALISGVLLAGVSVSGIAASDVLEEIHEKHTGHDRLPQELPLEAIDLVEIVRGYDEVQGELLALLRDAGFANRELTDLLPYLGADQRLLGDVKRAAGMRVKLDAMDARIAATKEKLDVAVASGKMSKDEARARFHLMQTEIETHRARMQEEHEHQSGVHRRILHMEARGLSREQIDRELRPERMRRRAMQENRAQEEADAKIRGMRDHLDDAVAAGKVTPEKAEQYLQEMTEKVKRDLHRVAEEHERQVTLERTVDDMRARGMTEEEIKAALHERELAARGEWRMQLRDRELEGIKARMHELKKQLGAKVEAGDLTDAEARTMLEQAHEKIAARLRASEMGMKRRIRDRRRTEDEVGERLPSRLDQPRRREIADEQVERKLYRDRIERHIAELQHRLEDDREAGRDSTKDLERRLLELRAIVEKLGQ